MAAKQQTLKAPISFSGTGLHTGVKVTMTVHPAPENSGIVFRRIDLEGKPEIPALCDYVTDTSRGTTIEKAGARVATIEHIMSALWTLGVDNATIDVDAGETPIMDGSAKEYAKTIVETGLQPQEAERTYYHVTEKMVYTIPEKGVAIILYPDDEFSVSLHVDYNSKVIGNQYATFNPEDDYASKIAPCRTFVFLHDLEPLMKMNLIKGGDLDNAIVIYEREMSQENYDKLADVMGVPHMDAKQLGYINHKPLVWPNECARHKLLDVIGDLALIGKPIKGRIIATRPGHTIYNKFARQMRKEIRLHEIQAPTYDCNREPIMDVNRIRELLPHRYPMQLVDKVIEIGANYIVGVKNVTSNEPFFQGHFPQEPVMPGVLQIEAMAQTGGLLVLNSVDEPERFSTYFMKIDGVKFRQKVVPGDTLIFRVELMAPIRRGISTMKGYVFVGEKVVCEAEFMAQIVKNK